MANALVVCPHCGCSSMQSVGSGGGGSRQCPQCKKSFKIEYRDNKVTRVFK